METPKGTMTIAEAAEKWIAMVESPENAKASSEQKANMIAQIRAAAPKAQFPGIDAKKINGSFVDATNAIKAIMRGGK